MPSLTGNVIQDTDETFPVAIQYTLWDTSADWSDDIAYLREELKDKPGYKEQEVKLYAIADDTSRTGIMKNSDYKDMMNLLNRKPVTVRSGEVYYVRGETGDMSIGGTKNASYDSIQRMQRIYLKLMGSSQRYQVKINM